MTGARTLRKPGRTVLSPALALLWLGMLLGVSFLATPVKFMAPSLTLPVALDVGRQTFSVFVPIELGLGICVLALSFWGREAGWAQAIATLLVAIVAAQLAWLLPSLDARVALILDGDAPAPSSLHEIYIALDAAKLAALAWMQMRSLSASPRRAAPRKASAQAQPPPRPRFKLVQRDLAERDKTLA